MHGRCSAISATSGSGDEEYEYDRYGDEPKECPAVITDDLYDMVFELVKGKACNEEDIPDSFAGLCG